ncbi:inosine-5'-monophosphate dehydrogenase-like [Brachypodium distachyon]|nr:inosine-5'-monophosphate dehydrogenase-like [Brachypodium distachyon]|eukprot:XP_010239381.1 inosine-5'-monophosphate dehydrogenase-like [Brachypodium distachyon]
MAPSSADLAGDGFSAERLFSQGVSYTYDDIILHPGFIDFPADVVDLSRGVSLSIPCVASPMDTVSESAMASLGGGAVVHCNTEPHIQASIVRAAKSRRLPFVSSVPFFSPASAPSPNDFAGHDYAIVTERGDSLSKLVGVAVAADAASSGAPVPVSECMCPAPRSASASFDFEQAAAFLADEGLDYAPLVPPK